MALRKPSLVDLADLVTSATNTRFSVGATRQNVATVSRTSMATLVVVVVPGTKTLTRKTRDIAMRDYQIEIGLFQAIDLTPAAGAKSEDDLIVLAEEILEWWVDEQQGVTVADPDGDIPVVCHGGRLANDEPLDINVRRTDQAFRAIIQLDFKVI